jgi:hypothetical protein
MELLETRTSPVWGTDAPQDGENEAIPTTTTTTTSSRRATTNVRGREEEDMRKIEFRASLAASMAFASMLGVRFWVGADDDHHRVKANLSAYQETPSTLSTPGTGQVHREDRHPRRDHRLQAEPRRA